MFERSLPPLSDSNRLTITHLFSKRQKLTFIDPKCMLNLRVRIRSDMPSWCLDLFKTCCSAIEDKKGSLDGFLNLKRTFNWLSCFYIYELMVPGSVSYMLLPGLSLMYGYIINSQHFKIVQSFYLMDGCTEAEWQQAYTNVF